MTELRTLAREIRNYQLQRDWSDTRLCKEIAHVGSTKTYKRILDPTDPLDELNLETQHRNYTAAVEYLHALRAKDRPAEPEYDDFANILTARAAVQRALTEDQDCVARLVIIEGNTATGKDAVRRHLQKIWPKITLAVEATELWRATLTAPARAIHAALHIVKQADKDNAATPQPPRAPAELIDEMLAALRERKLVLIINEAHHLGPRGLNLIKTIINQTPTIVVLACIPTLLTRLLSNNYEEAIQLTGNRLAERVYLRPPPPDEILAMMERRGLKFTDPATRHDAAKQLAADAPHFGNWRYIIQVIRRLLEKKIAVTSAQLNAATNAIKAHRTRIAKAPAA